MWNGKPECPYCPSQKMATPVPREMRYHCNSCKTSFSVTAKTIFHKTKVDLQKWFYVIVNQDVGISARQLAKDIDVTKDTACFMTKRIRQVHHGEKIIIHNIYQSLLRKINNGQI